MCANDVWGFHFPELKDGFIALSESLNCHMRRANLSTEPYGYLYRDHVYVPNRVTLVFKLQLDSCILLERFIGKCVLLPVLAWISSRSEAAIISTFL